MRPLQCSVGVINSSPVVIISSWERLTSSHGGDMAAEVQGGWVRVHQGPLNILGSEEWGEPRLRHATTYLTVDAAPWADLSSVDAEDVCLRQACQEEKERPTAPRRRPSCHWVNTAILWPRQPVVFPFFFLMLQTSTKLATGNTEPWTKLKSLLKL